jgi:hypothetical protein
MEMKKLLTIGVIFLFIGVALAPSINSSVLKTSTDNEMRSAQGTVKSKIVRQPVNIILKRMIGILIKGDLPRHPLLYFIVVIVYKFRTIRGVFLIDKSEYRMSLLLLLRGFWLVLSALIWYGIWANISDVMGWNWPTPSIPE